MTERKKRDRETIEIFSEIPWAIFLCDNADFRKALLDGTQVISMSLPKITEEI